MADLNLPNSFTTQGGAGYSFGNRFTVTEASYATDVLWWRDGTSPFPTKVYLTNVTTNTELVALTNGALGWVDQGNGWWLVSLGQQVVLGTADTYVTTVYLGTAGSQQAYTSDSVTPDPPLVAGLGAWANGDQDNPDNTGGGAFKYGVSPVVTAGAPPPPDPDPDPNEGTFHEAAIWLQFGNPNLRADSLAKLIYDYLGGLGDVIAQIDASTVNLPPLLSTLTSAWLQARQADIAAILAEVDNLQAHIVGAGVGGGSAFYGPAGTQVAAGVEQLLAAAPRLSWADGDVLAPSAHSLADTLPFTGQVGWGSGYALHRIHFATSDDKHPLIGLGAAGAWIPGIGWWAPMLPDGSLGRRTVCEFQDQWCWPVPSAAVGLVLWVHPSVTGTIEAYAVPAASP